MGKNKQNQQQPVQQQPIQQPATTPATPATPVKPHKVQRCVFGYGATTQAAALAAALAAHPQGATVKVLAAAAGVASVNRAASHYLHMLGKGTAARTAKGTFAITPLGAALLAANGGVPAPVPPANVPAVASVWANAGQNSGQ